MADELKPCPFCGGDAVLRDGECGIRGMPMTWRNPQCTRCGCDLGYCHHLEAVERWNRRALSHAAGQEAPINPAEIDRKLVGGEAVFPVAEVVQAFDGSKKIGSIYWDRLAIGDKLYLTPAQPPASAEVGGTNCKRFDVYERVVWTSKLGTKFCGAVRHINAPEPLSYFVDLDDGTSVQRAMPSDLASSGRKGDEMP